MKTSILFHYPFRSLTLSISALSIPFAFLNKILKHISILHGFAFCSLPFLLISLNLSEFLVTFTNSSSRNYIVLSSLHLIINGWIKKKKSYIVTYSWCSPLHNTTQNPKDPKYPSAKQNRGVGQWCRRSEVCLSTCLI